MRSIPFLSSAQLLSSFAPFGAPGGVPPPVSHSFLLEALPSVAFSARLLSSVTHQPGLAAASEVLSRPPRARQGSGSPTAPSLHGDSALICRLVWGGTAARWREGLVSYGMRQGDNLSGYNWQERGENGTLARTGNQRVASPTAFHEREICTTSRPAGWSWAGFVVHFNAACFIRRMETLAFTLARWFCSLRRTTTRYSEFASLSGSTLSTCSLPEARR